jgi:hypothetical protein
VDARDKRDKRGHDESALDAAAIKRRLDAARSTGSGQMFTGG